MSFPDRALKRMVVDLAALHPDDAASVLDELEAPQKKKVEALLNEFSNFGFGERLQPAEVPAVDATRISPWLLERIDPASGTGRITAQTRAALKACALRLYPAPLSNHAPPRTAIRRVLALFGAEKTA